MHVPEFFETALRNLGGTDIYGDPRYRVVFAPDERLQHGIRKGGYKYCDPRDPKQPMPCWILEVKYPAEYFGDPQDWREDLLGPFPSRGMYGCKSPLITYLSDGTPVALELDETCLDSIRQNHFADLEWQKGNAKQRLEAIEEMLAKTERERVERADTEAENLMDEFHRKKHELEQEDKRVWSMPKKYEVATRNSKMPVRP